MAGWRSGWRLGLNSSWGTWGTQQETAFENASSVSGQDQDGCVQVAHLHSCMTCEQQCLLGDLLFHLL